MELWFLCKSKTLTKTFFFLDFRERFLIFVLYFMQNILLSLLAILSRMIIHIHKPYIIGVTGTVGKTTISTYIASYLEILFPGEVGISPYHYNGEYGLPLSIIWAKTGWKNPFLWLWVFLVALSRCVRKYPKYLILEYGIDHPWEMEFLLSITTPDIAILSPVTPNHLQQFGTLESYRAEKLLLLKMAKHRIVHESLRPYIESEAIYYGTWGMSEVDASHFHFSLSWVSADINVYDQTFHITLPSFGAYQVENILPCYVLSVLLDLDASIISKNAHIFIPESGRSSILPGKNRSIIIDGSYNGWYESICRGIDSIVPFLPSHQVILFLWDMRELWDQSADIHYSLARYILEHIDRERDLLICLVGPMMEKYLAPVVSPVFDTLSDLSSRTLWDAISERLLSEDRDTIVYVKWSQNTIFLEEWIKKFLLHTKDVTKLPRQSKEWMKKKEEFFMSIIQK